MTHLTTLEELIRNQDEWGITFSRHCDADNSLYEANLYEADLSYANLLDADLSGADLSYANLRGADLSRADLRGADLSGATGLLSASHYLLSLIHI